jgi:cephalosporin-C deacetylase
VCRRAGRRLGEPRASSTVGEPTGALAGHRPRPSCSPWSGPGHEPGRRNGRRLCFHTSRSAPAGAPLAGGANLPSIDLPLEQLRVYRPLAEPPADLDGFWSLTLAEARRHAGPLELEPAGPPLTGVTAHAVVFPGSDGGRVSGWYLRPHGEGPVPGVVVYHGYSGRAPRPLELYTLAAQGVAVLSMDCRGQAGDAPGSAEPASHGPGWLTEGLRDPSTYYYRAVYADAVLAADALCERPEVDASRVAVTGISQGGGLTLAAAALSERPAFAWSDVPFLCDFPRAVEVATDPPYLEIAYFLRRRPDLERRAFETLSYFDVANLAPRITCPVVVTTALWDTICPPSTVFGAFSRLEVTDRDLRVWRFHGHTLPYENDEQRLVTLLERLGVDS